MFVYDRRARSSCWKSATMWERLKFHLPLAFICIAASAVLLMLRQFLLNTNVSFIVEVILGIIAAVLFLFGVCLIIIFWRRRLHNPTQVVVSSSSIPDENLEKSPAPILPYNHVPHRVPFAVNACSVGLPDYFTAIQKFDESTFDSTLNADVWTEDVPENPPPCYEKALEMTSLALTVAANQVDASASEQYDFTQETMDTSDEIFV